MIVMKKWAGHRWAITAKSSSIFSFCLQTRRIQVVHPNHQNKNKMRNVLPVFV
jgi:hypothetical protein